MKKISIVVIAVFLSFILSSCSVLDDFFSGIGYDTHDYSLEPVISQVTENSEKWKEISEMLRILTLDSTHLNNVDGMRDALKYHKNSLLNYMLSRNFEMYAGNTSLLEEISKAYPSMNVIYAIPKSDYESEAYKYFGGSVKISHSSSELFLYLEDFEMYIPVSEPIKQNIDILLISANETENTYKIEFSLSNDEKSEIYNAIIVKREDGTLYFRLIMLQSD